MNEIVNAINGVIWSPALIYLCLGVGLYFSLRSRFLQLRHMKEMVRLMFQGKGNDAGVSSFQALSMTLAGRVGTGNIAGVATAITFGGPGALFWMWMVAFLGASSAFVESTLGQVYKEKINGEYRGGPAFYIEKGLGMKWYAWTFAIATIFACGVLLPGVQANSIGSSLQTAFDIDPNVTAAGLALLLGFIIFGGVKRIANFASTVVPFMALGYIIVACVIIALNIGQLPGVILLIWKSAFGMEAGFGAILGLAIMWGVKRGVYSNEAAQGTGPHASSAAAVSHPAKQGLVQAFSVYIDTLFVCSATGFMLLITGLYNVQVHGLQPMPDQHPYHVSMTLCHQHLPSGIRLGQPSVHLLARGGITQLCEQRRQQGAIPPLGETNGAVIFSHCHSWPPICTMPCGPLDLEKMHLMGKFRILSSSTHHLLMSIHKLTK